MPEHTSTLHDSIRTVNRNQWNDLVEQSDLGSVFHRYEWLLAIESGVEHIPTHVVVRKNGNPVGIFPNFVTDFDVPSYERVLSLLPAEHIPYLPSTSIDTLSPDVMPLKQLTSISPGFGGPVIVSDEMECLDLMFQQIPKTCGHSVISHKIKAKEPGYM